MAAYRLYCLDAVGRVARTGRLEASSDQEAIRLAHEQLAGAARCELWRNHRLIARIDPS